MPRRELVPARHFRRKGGNSSPYCKSMPCEVFFMQSNKHETTIAEAFSFEPGNFRPRVMERGSPKKIIMKQYVMGRLFHDRRTEIAARPEKSNFWANQKRMAKIFLSWGILGDLFPEEDYSSRISPLYKKILRILLLQHYYYNFIIHTIINITRYY